MTDTERMEALHMADTQSTGQEKSGRGRCGNHKSGPGNGNWKGGRTLASTGYVLLRLPGHHLADVRGYVYEHRLIAEQKLGRRLMKGEISHHVNGIKTDNRPENIEIVESRFAHMTHHRKRESGRQRPHESNTRIACVCGCGKTFEKFDAGGRPRRFVTGHNTMVRHGR